MAPRRLLRVAIGVQQPAFAEHGRQLVAARAPRPDDGLQQRDVVGLAPALSSVH